jgi:ATP-binding cassette, subfamily B, bacterial PglK
LNVVQKILFLLGPKEKRRGVLVLGLVTVMAGLETASVASVMPFLAVLGDPELVQTNTFLAALYVEFGFESTDSFLRALGVAAFALILFAAIFRSLTHYIMNRFIEMRRHSIGQRLLETYLRQPYVFFLNRHSGDMAKSILSEVDQLIGNVFRPCMQMTAYAMVLVALVSLLVAVDPLVALWVAVLIGGMYGGIFLAVRAPLERVGRARLSANKERFEATSEALGGIKDIKLLGREHAYLTRFRGPSIRQARYQAVNQTLSEVPKFLIEAVGFGGVIALALALLAVHGPVVNGSLGDVLPILGLYAFAGYRMLPAAQHVYAGFAKLRFGSAAVDSIYDDLRERAQLAEMRVQAPEPLRPKHAITLDHVSYEYPNAPRTALRDINLRIPVGTMVGLVGATGAGKTTLVDVLLGLLRPTEGAILVDGNPVTDESLFAWQQALGYVPQVIFLTDSTVAENIALGLSPDEIDYAKVVRCAEMAQVHDFITHELSDQYSTMVGERGVRLSGGQRQRIGIARALYHNPDVLVFDEATSALDSLTERAVMESIEALWSQKTIFLIAHRFSTVRKCDQIVLLEHGQIATVGCYEDLKRDHEAFRAMLDPGRS